MLETKQVIGKKQYQAAEFMIELLAEGEMLSEEVYQLAAQHGISTTTLNRAKHVARVKVRRAGGKWHMFVPDDAREYFTDCVSARGDFSAQAMQRSCENAPVSSDWVSVVAGSSQAIACEALLDRISGGLHVKVGAVEFTADSAFPAEKLIEVLRGLGVGNEC